MLDPGHQPFTLPVGSFDRAGQQFTLLGKELGILLGEGGVHRAGLNERVQAFKFECERRAPCSELAEIAFSCNRLEPQNRLPLFNDFPFIDENVRDDAAFQVLHKLNLARWCDFTFRASKLSDFCDRAPDNGQ